MNVIAIIPARGGSKGVPRKNLIEVNGRSLVAHSIVHALESKLINRVLVSTDDEEIRDVSLQEGAEVPFLRPKELAADDTLDLPVFEHALKWLESEENYTSDIVVHLRPTTPYRKSGWIDEAIQILIDIPEADSVKSVSKPFQHPYRMFRIRGYYLDPLMKAEHPTPYVLRRQDLPGVYYYNCVIDVTKPATIFGGSMTGTKIVPFILNPEEVVDIDSERDIRVAEFLFERDARVVER